MSRSLSARGPEKRVGADEQWDVAEAGLKGALERNGMAYSINAGDGAFYGPEDRFPGQATRSAASGSSAPCSSTTSCRSASTSSTWPTDGTLRRPVMIHRAMLGSVERFLGILIEHTAGAFPMWLAPVQVKVLPVSEKTLEYSRGVAAELTAAGLRVELDESNEKLGYKIRQAQLEKVPYMLVVGAKEAEQGSAAVRLRSGEDLGAIAVAELLPRLVAQATRRATSLPEAS